MPRIKPVVARTAEELAEALGLDAAAAREWGQHAPLKRLNEIVTEIGAHTDFVKRARTTLNDNSEHVSSDLLIRILGSLRYRVSVSVVRADTAA